MRPKTTILLSKDWFQLKFLVFFESTTGTMVRVPKEIEYRQLSESEPFPPEAIVDLPLDCGQQLVDQLWQLGYRPSSGISSTGQDEAQKDHINDLRDIVRTLLSIK